MARQITHPFSGASALVLTAWLRQLRRECQTVYERAEAAELRATTSLARFWQSQDKRQDAWELAAYALAPVPFRRAVGVAMLNALSALAMERHGVPQGRSSKVSVVIITGSALVEGG